MKKNILKSLLVTSILVSGLYLISFKPAKAITVTETGPSLGYQAVIAANTTQIAFNAYTLNFKEFTLDGLAGMFAKQIIRSLTQSVVNWINSGFEGSPSFVTNPGAFFLDLADQETGRFLSKYGGPLVDLCSPFSIDLRIALAFKYHPNIQNRYTCTLNTIIQNSKNAIEGANINGFTAGDFRQGGWPAFISLTTEPQNNIYGAYIQADSELSLRVANLQLQRREELNQGRGFLSWRKCSDSGSEEEYYAKQDLANAEPGSEEAYYAQQEVKNLQNCEVQTPGSVIVSALESNVNGPLHELQLADEFNEIVNALFAQLVTQVLTKGLGTVSGSGAGDSSAYINQITQESQGVATSIVESMLPNIDVYLTNTREYKTNKDASVREFIGIKAEYEAAKSCYEYKITNLTNVSNSDRNYGYGMIAEIESMMARDITPTATRLLNEARRADDNIKTLLDIKSRAEQARTVNEIRGPSEQYNRLLQSQTLATAKTVLDAKNELEEIKTDSAGLRQAAERKQQECALFPFNR